MSEGQRGNKMPKAFAPDPGAPGAASGSTDTVAAARGAMGTPCGTEAATDAMAVLLVEMGTAATAATVVVETHSSPTIVRCASRRFTAR